MNPLNKGIGVAGSTTIDRIITADHKVVKMGGVTTYAGITYRRHGVPVLIVSNIAEQDREIRNRLQAEDIAVFSAETNLSTCFVNYNRSNLRYQELTQHAESIKIGQIQSIIGRVAALHLGPLHPFDIETESFRYLQNSDLQIFLDVQGYTRRVKRQKIYQTVSVQMAAGLRLAHIAKANEAEYNAIRAFFNMTPSELIHYFEIDEFVVTLGDRGGFVLTRNGEIIHYDAILVKTPVDPTGAGDVFLAAYVVSRYMNGKNIPDACGYAAKTAARQVEGKFITADRLRLG